MKTLRPNTPPWQLSGYAQSMRDARALLESTESSSLDDDISKLHLTAEEISYDAYSVLAHLNLIEADDEEVLAALKDFKDNRRTRMKVKQISPMIFRMVQDMVSKYSHKNGVMSGSKDKYGVEDYEPYRDYLDDKTQEQGYDAYSMVSDIVEEEEDIDFTTALADYYFKNDGGRKARKLKKLSPQAYQAVMNVAMDIFEGDNVLGFRK